MRCVISSSEAQQPDLESPNTAYCAPGAREAAELALARGGHSYRELVESPYLEGREDQVLLIHDKATDEMVLDALVPRLELPPPTEVLLMKAWWKASAYEPVLSRPLITGVHH